VKYSSVFINVVFHKLCFDHGKIRKGKKLGKKKEKKKKEKNEEKK